MGAGGIQAFKMEYVVYILGVAVITLLCMTVFRVQSEDQHRNPLSRSAKDSCRRGIAPGKARNIRLRKTSLGTGLTAGLDIKRQLNGIRTPWGWPRHRELNGKLNGLGHVRPVLSDLVYSFADRLIRPRELVHGQPRDPRIRNSIRALLEDRYGRVSHHSVRSIEYRRVKAPLLGDPNAPPDQMDNFGAGEAVGIRHKLPRMVSVKVTQGKAAISPGYGRTQLEEIKLPWGW